MLPITGPVSLSRAATALALRLRITRVGGGGGHIELNYILVEFV